MDHTWKRLITLSIMIFLVVFSLGVPFPVAEEGTAQSESIPSGTTIQTTQQLETVIAAAGDNLLLFDLYADWCLPCRILTPLLEEIAREESKRIMLYKINIDKHPEIAQIFRVTAIPFVALVKNKEIVHAFTGVQPKAAYLRVINDYSKYDQQQRPDTPDGELVQGLRIIKLSPMTSPGNMYVYRGETVKIVLDRIDFPYSVHLPDFNISQEGVIGKNLEVTFKVKNTGVFPIFCNGNCPTDDGMRYGNIVVLPYQATDEVEYHELDNVAAEKLIQESQPLILDVRTPAEYYRGHLEKAKLIPLQQLTQRWSEIRAYKDKEILLYCRSGNRTVVAAQILINKGFKKLYSLKNGLRSWIQDGNKVM